jgi:hypothetical protein
LARPHGVSAASLIVLLAGAGVRVHAESAEASRRSLAVNIVPTSSSEKVGQAIELFDKDRHFHVVVTNLSSAPIKLWEEWCSWGYFDLSFEARDVTGRRFVISKKMRGWDKNFPCPVTIGAGRAWVIDVNLDPSIWQNSPLSSDRGQATLRLRAVFEISEDEASKANGVWTGKVSSPEDEYKFYWVNAAAKATRRRLLELEAAQHPSAAP